MRRSQFTFNTFQQIGLKLAKFKLIPGAKFAELLTILQKIDIYVPVIFREMPLQRLNDIFQELIGIIR